MFELQSKITPFRWFINQTKMTMAKLDIAALQRAGDGR